MRNDAMFKLNERRITASESLALRRIKIYARTALKRQVAHSNHHANFLFGILSQAIMDAWTPDAERTPTQNETLLLLCDHLGIERDYFKKIINLAQLTKPKFDVLDGIKSSGRNTEIFLKDLPVLKKAAP